VRHLPGPRELVCGAFVKPKGVAEARCVLPVPGLTAILEATDTMQLIAAHVIARPHEDLMALPPK